MGGQTGNGRAENFCFLVLFYLDTRIASGALHLFDPFFCCTGLAGCIMLGPCFLVWTFFSLSLQSPRRARVGMKKILMLSCASNRHDTLFFLILASTSHLNSSSSEGTRSSQSLRKGGKRCSGDPKGDKKSTWCVINYFALSRKVVWLGGSCVNRHLRDSEKDSYPLARFHRVCFHLDASRCPSDGFTCALLEMLTLHQIHATCAV